MELLNIPISAIEVAGRYRKDFGDVEELAEDIRENGLINPLTLKALSNGTYQLLAGERRLRACLANKLEEVPARIYHRDLTEREQLCIELSENIKRKDFTYQEEVALKKRIHDLHVAEFGEKVSRSPEAPGWSGSDTAKFLGTTRQTISTDLRLAKLIEEFPDFGWEKCKTKKEALKLVEGFGRQAIVANRVAEVTKERESGSIDTYRQRILDAYIVGDFFEHAEKMEPNLFNIIEIDPPYAIDLRETKRGYGYGADYNEVLRNKYNEFLSRTFKHCYRLLKPGGWLLCWFAPEPWFEEVYQLLLKHHFITHRMCGIWVKSTGQTNQPKTTLANTYEMFFYARKGDSALTKQGRSNVFTYSPVHPSRKVHPTERPTELMQELFETFALPGDRLLVPFAGSGVSLRAGFHVGLKPVGFDLTQSYKDAYTVQVMEDYQCQKSNDGTVISSGSAESSPQTAAASVERSEP